MNKHDYYLDSTIKYYSKNSCYRENFLKKNTFLFDEISNSLKKLINNSNFIKFFCCGNSIITKNINSNNIHVDEINPIFLQTIKLNNNVIEKKAEKISDYDHVIIADIEHQKYITKNLMELSEKINDECRVIVLSKSLIWCKLINFYKKIIKKSGPTENSFLPYSNLKNIFTNTNFEILRNEKIVFMPIKIPLVTSVINSIFRLPILNFFCMLNLTVLKKKIRTNFLENYKISFIIPCKNEEDNIKLFNEHIKNFPLKAEFLFGDDNSTDSTRHEINKIKNLITNREIKIYEGPGLCKSENVYKGIDLATGEIILIYDADLTVTFDDLINSINLLLKTNSDMINCSRMIIPQKKYAMKFFNFLGNSFFAFLFSILFKQKITDTLCGTKIFYKKDWNKIKGYNGLWGAKDLWGDFDLLIGAYKNNLKIAECPISYIDRKAGHTKMKGIIKNAARMLIITLSAYYKLRLKIL